MGAVFLSHLMPLVAPPPSLAYWALGCSWCSSPHPAGHLVVALNPWRRCSHLGLIPLYPSARIRRCHWGPQWVGNLPHPAWSLQPIDGVGDIALAPSGPVAPCRAAGRPIFKDLVPCLSGSPPYHTRMGGGPEIPMDPWEA